ncbi:hypothetical protein G7Y79_00002g007700 [Physcia stellaris]|nr:hypothetical protein G7Y79_00002g007700 [Physcia stellaris]
MPATYDVEGHHALRRLQSDELQLENPHFNKNSDQHPVNLWIVPFGRNHYFTGRESELVELHSMLFTNNQFTKSAISGLGGVGKTQLVLEFIYRLREKHEYYSVIWIQATSIESLEEGYNTVVGQLGIQGSGANEVDIKKLVQDILSEDSAGHWILVFDNVDDINMWIDKPTIETQQSVRLIDYISRSKFGRVIFTTRDRKVGVELAHQNVIDLSQVNEDTATRMLRNLLRRKELVDSEPVDTKAMLAWLTYLPLAIAQAAAYINENIIDVADYLALLGCQEEEAIELLTEDFEDDARYFDMKDSVATTWLISFQRIQQRDSLAAGYLSFMACIDHKDVPQLLLPPGPSRKKEMDSIGTLSDYSFVIRQSEDLALDLNRLVHLTVRNWLRTQNLLAQWTRRAVERLEEVFPDHEHRNRAVWRMYLSHARYALVSSLVPKNDPIRISLEWKIAMCYYHDGCFNEAETFFREVMEFRTIALGPEHPDTLKSITQLALTYHAQSRFQESKVLGLRAMEAQKRVLGEKDLETLSTMSHLAMTYSDLSQWKEAEELALHTMELRMRVLGAEHPDTLVGMSNLVYLYNCQGWWKQAEELGKQVISGRKKVLGVEHPDTLLSIGNLAHTYNNQGRYRDAEELLVQVMDLRIRVLGKNHPHTLSGMSNLGVSYHNQGRFQEAEALQAQVVVARKTLLGSEHFSTLTSMAHLASTYHSQGRPSEAEELGLEVLELRTKVLGPEHHHTLTGMTNLASIYLNDGQLAKAEELGLQVLAIRIRVLGMEHHHSLASMEHLAATYKKQGRLKESEDLKMQVAEIGKKMVS